MRALLLFLITITNIHCSFSQHLNAELGFNGGYDETSEGVIAFNDASN